ncbi:two-component regulator propeller domain-containing protein [Inhella sp.]|uniref:ligand-binding sensor domain-containing protein n=1 Tax=Inhella sp. TaxID=1921806 RepID=UPI0035B13FB1
MRCAVPRLAWTLALLTGAWGSAQAHHEPGALDVQFRSVPVPQNQVPSLAQDRRGFLWVATSEGLMRFDGYRLRPIEQGSGSALRRNLGWIRALSPGRDGRMWIGSDSQGLLSYDPARDRVESHSPSGTVRAVIRALLEDDEGQVWIATVGQGLQRFRPATGQLDTEAIPWREQTENRVMALHRSPSGQLWAAHWRGLAQRVNGRWQDLPLPEAPEGATVLSLLEDEDGRLWFGTQDGRLGVVERGRARWVLTQLQVAVHALAQARDGMLWVGTKSGLLWVDPVSGAIRQRLRPDARRPLGLAGSDISQLLRDQDGAMWVAGFGVGLQRHQHHPAFTVRGADLEPNAPLAEADVRSVLGLRNGRVLVTTQTGLVVELDGRPEQGLATRGIWPRERRTIVEFMAEGPDGNLWMASAGRLEQRTPAGRLLHDWPLDGGRAQQILPRANGEVWLGMQEGLYRLRSAQSAALERVQPAGGQPLTGAVHALIEDPRDQSVWVGGQLGLYRWQQDALRPVAEAPGEGLGSPIVMALLVGRNGTLWVDTAVSGLHRLRGFDSTQRARFERISESLGVDGRFGGNLREDSLGRIWSQMLVYDPRQHRIDRFGPAEGAAFGTYWFFSNTALPDGRLLFGGSAGILQVAPLAYHSPPLHPGGAEQPAHQRPTRTGQRADRRPAPAARHAQPGRGIRGAGLRRPRPPALPVPPARPGRSLDRGGCRPAQPQLRPAAAGPLHPAGTRLGSARPVG